MSRNPLLGVFCAHKCLFCINIQEDLEQFLYKICSFQDADSVIPTSVQIPFLSQINLCKAENEISMGCIIPALGQAGRVHHLEGPWHNF